MRFDFTKPIMVMFNSAKKMILLVLVGIFDI